MESSLLLFGLISLIFRFGVEVVLAFFGERVGLSSFDAKS